jgi:hypothetical protein
MASNRFLMKKIFNLTFLLAFLVSGIAFGQGGNLKFERVINYSVPSQTVLSSTTPSGNRPFFSIPINIPTSKVWKIQSLGANTNNNWIIQIDNYNLNNTSNYNYPVAEFPIWLPEGNYNFSALGNVNTPSQLLHSVSISILEFSNVN